VKTPPSGGVLSGDITVEGGVSGLARGADFSAAPP
jgi:hypothetical protein